MSLSGDLDMSEFVNYLQQHEQQLHIVFSSLDQNKDGIEKLSEIPTKLKLNDHPQNSSNKIA